MTPVDGKTAGSPFIVEVNKVSKRFAPKNRPVVDALSDVSLQITAGEFVSILGPSGCGKSTLLSIIGGLMTPTQGAVQVLGKRVVGPVTPVGTVFQRDLLLPWRSALDNVLLQAEIRGLPKEQYRGRAMALLDSVGLADFASHLPRELSGGMRQRVAIVRALLHAPPILLMDEPFAALDAITRDEMNLELLRMARPQKDDDGDTQTTVIFITHSVEEAVFLSDRVVVLAPRPGRIVEDATVPLSRPRTLDARDTTSYRECVHKLRVTLEDMGAFGRTRTESDKD
jgi:NitT/TauT family transport system ATP-binding protein